MKYGKSLYICIGFFKMLNTKNTVGAGVILLSGL